MEFIETIKIWFVEWFANAFFSILATYFIYMAYKRFRWGGWKVKVLDRQGNLLTEREISPRKAELIFDDDSDLSVYIKGVCSFYDKINMDLVTEGRKNGFLTINDSDNEIIVDYRKNSKSEKDTVL